MDQETKAGEQDKPSSKEGDALSRVFEKHYSAAAADLLNHNPQEAKDQLRPKPELDGFARLRELEQKAHPGPWEWSEAEINGRHTLGPLYGYDHDMLEGAPGNPNWELVRAFRNAVPAILVEATAHWKATKAMRSAIKCLMLAREVGEAEALHADLVDSEKALSALEAKLQEGSR